MSPQRPTLTVPTLDSVPPVPQLRRQLASALRRRVAGDHAAERARIIWESAGERWFEPTDPIWRVQADASMFIGGLRALLLQSLHPLAMAAVAGHSGFRSDPWGRLQRTSDFLATTTFGTVEQAESVIARVRAIHDRMSGTAEDGRPYAASDPKLLTWVHVAEVDSFLRAQRRFGTAPLTDEEADRYVAQASVVAVRLGVPDPPLTVSALADAIEAFRPQLSSTRAARDAARFLVLSPPLPLSARPAYAPLAAAAVALLPYWARVPLRLPCLPLSERLLGLPAGEAATRVIRWAMSAPAADEPAAV